MMVHYCRTLQKGSLLIDSSTIDPAVAQDMAKRASDAGAVYMDAPVSGGEWFSIKYSRLVPFDLYSVRPHHELALCRTRIHAQVANSSEIICFNNGMTDVCACDVCRCGRSTGCAVNFHGRRS